MDEIIKDSTKLASAIMDVGRQVTYNDGFSWQFTKNQIDTFSIDSLKTYKDEVKLCRFFYKRDPLASTVINKIVDFALTELEIERKKLSLNEYKIYKGVVNLLLPFLEQAALEYMITGMAVCEVSYGAVSARQLKKWGIKKIDSIVIPTDFWVRDSETIIINRPFIGSKSTYAVEIPSELAYFIKNKGIYPDGTKDGDLYSEINQNFPEFVARVLSGETKIVLDNPIVIERRKLSNSPYPVPYLTSALESLKYKRALRKMDYSLASRVITAIQLITLGDRDFPLLEEDEDKLLKLKEQINARDKYGDYERVYQLFGNHTLKVSWVMPDASVLLNDTKYKDINLDILFALGFPRILVTGETDKSNTSSPEYALLSPIKTIENIQKNLLSIIQTILDQVTEYNGFTDYAEVYFKPMNLKDFVKFFDVLYKLYETGSISRKTLVDYIGLDLDKELENKVSEKDMYTKLGLDEYAPLPHSNTPDTVSEPQKDQPPEEESND